MRFHPFLFFATDNFHSLKEWQYFFEFVELILLHINQFLKANF